MQLHAVKTCKKCLEKALKNGIFQRNLPFDVLDLPTAARWRACRTCPKPWPSRMTWKFWKIASRRCARTGDTWQLYKPGDACRTYLDLYYGLICQLTFPDPAIFHRMLQRPCQTESSLRAMNEDLCCGPYFCQSDNWDVSKSTWNFSQIKFAKLVGVVFAQI